MIWVFVDEVVDVEFVGEGCDCFDVVVGWCVVCVEKFEM